MMWGMTNTTSTPAARRRALRDLIKQAATEDRFDMEDWAVTGATTAASLSEAAELHQSDPCNTVACAAGWAVTLMTPAELDQLAKSRGPQAQDVADWLGIQCNAFYPWSWHLVPGPLADARKLANVQHRDLTHAEQAEAFCNYLDSLD